MKVAVVQLALCLSLIGCAHPQRERAVQVLRVPQPLPEGHDEDWPMFRDDVERSGFAEGSAIGAHVGVAWHIPVFNTTEYGAAKGSPSVVGDMLYCGTDTGRFIAARISDGAIVWQVQFAGTSHGIHGTPAIVGDVVYIGAYDGTLYAFERMTGLLLWRHRHGYQVGSSPAVVPRWAMVFSSHERSSLGGGFVVALDARTGEQLWAQPTEAHPHSSVAVDVAKGTVFVGDNSGMVYMFDAHSGRAGWRRRLESSEGKSDVKTTPTVISEKNLLIVAAWSGKVYALDERTGETVWEHAAGGRLMGSTAYLAPLQMLYFGSPGGNLFALDARTGATLWAFHAGGRIMSSPAISGDGRAVIFGAADGKVYAVRADTGALVWDTFLGGQVSGSPALVGSRIYVTGKKSGLWALDTYD